MEPVLWGVAEVEGREPDKEPDVMAEEVAEAEALVPAENVFAVTVELLNRIRPEFRAMR